VLAFVVRVQVGNIDGTFVGSPVVVGALLGGIVGALVGTLVGSTMYFKITGGFRGAVHWLSVKVPDDLTIRSAKMVTERNMVITTSSNKFTLSRKKTVKVYYLGFICRIEKLWLKMKNIRSKYDFKV
jgi:hypothetical protein